MRIYNTLSRKKEDFVPINQGKIKMYCCGPTVYNYFHIGNARPFLFFDVVRRYFEYLGNEVIYVMNITDIDDKLIDQSLREKKSVQEISQKYIKAFYEDTKALCIKPAVFHPKATEYIGKMIKFIKELENKGFAYEKDGDVYFSVEEFKEYGKLSHRKIEDLKVGARVKANLNKKNPADFTLWKKAKAGEPEWGSPWGKGRPGWHTECVVMSQDLLGESFDIHGGGMDLQFPHHENEIAQAEALSGKPMVNYWMHNGFLNINGEKMSKSLDNFFITRDILKEYEPETIRFFFLSKHYRSPIDFNDGLMEESRNAMANFYNSLTNISFLDFWKDDIEYSPEILEFEKKFKDSMNDDFNTAKSIATLFELNKIIRNENKYSLKIRKQAAMMMTKLGRVLGFFENIDSLIKAETDHLSGDLINLLIEYRNDFKVDKNWKMADKIRNDLKKIGIELIDKKDEVVWKKIL